MAKYNEKYFGKNSEVCAVENMLSAGEQIILREKPKRNAYILAQVFKMMPFALLWIVFDGAFIGLMIGFELFKSMPAPLIVFLVVSRFICCPSGFGFQMSSPRDADKKT